MPSTHSDIPRAIPGPTAPGLPRKIAFIGCCVSVTIIMAIVAQNADSAGESRSMMMHQIKITMGKM